MVRRVLALVFVLALVANLAVTVFAHMKAAKMEPVADATVASVRRVQVWFTQAPDVKVSKLELAGPQGPVKLSGFQVTADKSIMANVEGDLSDGRYTARWQAAGDDGHIQKGEYRFSVKRAH
ncbi:MAG: copper resistance protein CopC [Vicinamibacterales bacterium]